MDAYLNGVSKRGHPLFLLLPPLLARRGGLDAIDTMSSVPEFLHLAIMRPLAKPIKTMRRINFNKIP